jgi:polysaccharide export outer membrane protein
VLEIKTIQELKEEGVVSVFGEVSLPGEYVFRQGMTIGDLVFEAGGYTFGAVPFRIEVSRRIKSDTTDLPASQNVKIFHLNLADNLELTSEERKFSLEPFDHVFIRKSPRYETQKIFTVLGQVNYPGNYTVRQSVERISDAITRAGGLKESAYLKAAQFRRRGAPIALDLNSILQKPDQPANLLLQQGDSLLIPEKQETVAIIGAVLNPSVVNYDKGYNIKDYLVQAGGFVDNANRKNLFVTHANGITDRTRRFLFFRSYPKVEPGSQIMVPLKEADLNKQPWSRGERVMLISSLTTVGVTLVRVMQEIWANK